MGFASYAEDIESRHASVEHRRRPSHVGISGKLSSQAGRSGHVRDTMPLRDFTLSTPRPLPVVLLADVSGSMAAAGKIDALNTAVAEMLRAFAEEDAGRAEIQVCVITFGGTASVHQRLTPADACAWTPMLANGQTPMGTALTLARVLLEDREQVPSRAYRPTLILVSDGQPNAVPWEEPLERLLGSERASKAQRFAMGIGSDADVGVLRKFLGEDQGRVFEAHEAREIRKFFRWVTMSVASRSRSARPDVLPGPDAIDLDDYGDF